MRSPSSRNTQGCSAASPLRLLLDVICLYAHRKFAAEREACIAAPSWRTRRAPPAPRRSRARCTARHGPAARPEWRGIDSRWKTRARRRAARVLLGDEGFAFRPAVDAGRLLRLRRGGRNKIYFFASARSRGLLSGAAGCRVPRSRLAGTVQCGGWRQGWRDAGRKGRHYSGGGVLDMKSWLIQAKVLAHLGACLVVFAQHSPRGPPRCGKGAADPLPHSGFFSQHCLFGN